MWTRLKHRQVAIFPAMLFGIWVFNLVGSSLEPKHDVKLKQILTPTTDVSFTEQQASLLFSEGFALYESGNMQGALDAYDQALSLYRRVQDQAGEGRTLINKGLVYKSLGQYDLALNCYQQALSSLREAGDLFNEGTGLNNIAAVYMSLGQYREALNYLEQALAIRHEAGDRLGEGVTLSNMGITYSEVGQYEQALSYLQQALAIRREVGDRPGEAATLNGIGLTYWRLKQSKQALEFYGQALTIYREMGNKLGEASILNNLGETYYDVGNYAQALENYQRALDLFQSLGAQAGEGTVLNNLGETYHRLDQPERALGYLQQSLAVLQEIGQRVMEGVVLNNIGEVYASQGQYQKALEFYKQALAIREEVGDRTGRVKTLHNIGWANEQLGDRAYAITVYQQAIEGIESIEGDIKIDELKASFASGQVETYERLIDLLWTEGRWTDAFLYAERARARAFLDQLASGALDFRAGVDATLLEQEQALTAEIAALHARLINLRNQPQSESNLNLIVAVEADLADREADYTQLLIEIKTESPEIASLVSVDVASLTDVQSLLDRKTTLVEYFVTRTRTLGFIITRDTFKTVTISVGRDDLAKTITAFRDFPSLNDPSPASLRQLYDWLIAPLNDELVTPAVGIIPHGVLHYLPFAALTNGTQYLGENYSLFTLPSASVLQFIQEKRKPDADNVLALGNPITELPDLQFAEQEAEFVASLYGTQAWIGSDATESAVRAQVGDAGILHLAAHGEYNSNNPLFSTIYLASDSENDGRLEVHEIFGLDLTKTTDLVVLSACQTNIGAVSAGDEVVGLNRAFIYAGTPTVLASLWNVDDAATALLMERFYIHLQAGMSKGEALQQAQKEVRVQYPHPYYWASFVLTGDPGEVTRQMIISKITPTAESTLDQNGRGPCAGLGLPLVFAMLAIHWKRTVKTGRTHL